MLPRGASRDPASVAAFFSANGSLQVNDGAPAVGREAIAAVAQSFMRDFPDLRVTMDKVLLKGQFAEFRWTLTGSNTGPGGTGNRVQISGYEEWQIWKDALISLAGFFSLASFCALR